MDNKDILTSLRDKAIKVLTDRIDSGEATAAELSVAARMLKDSGLYEAPSEIIEDSTPNDVIETLPYPVDAAEEEYEDKQRRSG